MKKIIDFEQTVYELCTLDPEIIKILSEIGFKDILKPGMLSTAGRLVTIPRGAVIKQLDMEIIKKTFHNYGYDIKDPC